MGASEASYADDSRLLDGSARGGDVGRSGEVMRRFFVAALTVASLASAVPAGAALPGASGSAYQVAMADWIRMHGSRGVFYAALGERLVDVGVETLGGVAKGTCSKIRGRHWIMIECSASGRLKPIPAEAFQLDPAFRSASLDVTAGGHDNHVAWTARELATSASESTAGEGGAYVAGARYAAAKAEASILGDELAGRCGCFLIEGAGVFAYSDASTRRALAIDGRSFSVTYRVKTPAR